MVLRIKETYCALTPLKLFANSKRHVLIGAL